MSYARRSDQDTPNHTSRPAAPHSRRLRTSLIGLALVSLFAQAAAPAARAGSITNYTIISLQAVEPPPLRGRSHTILLSRNSQISLSRGMA